MTWVKTIAEGLFGLFVEDGAFAAVIVLWVAAVWLLSLHVFQGVGWSGVVLFAGLALILLESAARRSRR